MKGFVPTPDQTVDLMVEKLFRDRAPTAKSRVLDPGSGRGAFVDGILRYCTRRNLAVPTIVAVESDPVHVRILRERFANVPRVNIRQADFLASPPETFDYIIGNPPYVSILGLSDDEKAFYRDRFTTAVGRFDLYILFFEKALKSLERGGRLVFITPEKYLYVNTAMPLRRLLSTAGVSELHFVGEDTFPDRVTYPLITVVDSARAISEFRVIDRNATERVVSRKLPGSSWLPIVRDAALPSEHPTLSDVALRVSCGVATGADSVFVVRNEAIPDQLRRFGYPTMSGREIVGRELPTSRSTMLVPYARDGSLLPESLLGSFSEYLSEPDRREKLLRRTCVRTKPWYAFHENPPLSDILRPKLLCKDIGAEPVFVVDRSGCIVPRHSLYYIVPRDPAILGELADYLNSPIAKHWLRDHCQRAANGFLRVQSHVLKRLPLPASLHPTKDQLSLPNMARARLRTA